MKKYSILLGETQIKDGCKSANDLQFPPSKTQKKI